MFPGQPNSVRESLPGFAPRAAKSDKLVMEAERVAGTMMATVVF